VIYVLNSLSLLHKNKLYFINNVSRVITDHDLQYRNRFLTILPYETNGMIAFNFTNVKGTNQSIFYVQSEKPEVEIMKVDIINGEYLTLCEVEMFGGE
jgi:hypothetical protein